MTDKVIEELEQMMERLEKLSRRFDALWQRRQWELTQQARIMRARMLTNYDEDKDEP